MTNGDIREMSTLDMPFPSVNSIKVQLSPLNPHLCSSICDCQPQNPVKQDSINYRFADTWSIPEKCHFCTN